MPRRTYETRSFGTALVTYLGTKGWSGLNYSEAFMFQKTIAPPQISVTIPTGNVKELQLGRVSQADKTYRRLVQVDAYMETERRAEAIIDDIMDFIDETAIIIVDPAGMTQGTFICPDSEAIIGEVFAPIITDPKLTRWRGAVRAPMEAHYP